MLRLRNLIGLMALSLLVACGSDSSDRNGNGNGNVDPAPTPTPEAAQLRITHASADAPAVNVYLGGERQFEGVDFKQSSGLVNIAEPGTFEVEVRGILPDGSEVTVIGPVDITLEGGERTDVFAIGNLFNDAGEITIAAALLEPVAIEDGITDVRVSVLHAAPEVPAVDIYVTAPGDDLANTSPITAAFGDSAGPVAIEADTEYQIRITPNGSSDVVFDSGTVSFPAGTELVLAAVENTFKLSPSPVTLLAVGPDSASEVVDVNTGASVRVVHNSADTPAVDVLVNGGEAIDALTFPNSTAFDALQAPAGTYNVVVAADVDNSIAPIDVDVTLEQTKSYTVIAVGSLNESSIAPILLETNRRNIATAALVEVIHGSYLVAAEIPVDIYLTVDGVIADVDPAVTGLAYQESTGQLPVAPGDYWITVTASGDKSVVAFDSGGTLALDGNVNYTIIARDPSAEEVGTPLINATILTD
ncbi:MAG: DUF4397 domain-containing protein [Halioglobus sp.]